MSEKYCLRRGECYQLGAVIPNVGWEKQPPLVYILSSNLIVMGDGTEVTSIDDYRIEYRGTLSDKDMARIELRYNKKKMSVKRIKKG